MCRWVAYYGEPTYLEDVILTPSHSLIRQSLHCREGATSTNGDGFGVGWYGDRAQPGLYREVLPAWNDLNLRSLSHQLKSHLFFAHVRASTGTATTRSNCHPFAYGKWLFMHNGQIGDYEKVRRTLEGCLDDRFYSARQGTTDSELMFLLMVQNGLDRDPAGAIIATIAEISDICGLRGIDAPFRLTICLSDGKHLYACRHATDDNPPSLYWRETETGTLVVSEPIDGEQGCWHKVPADTLLTLNGTLDMRPLYASSSHAEALAVPA